VFENLGLSRHFVYRGVLIQGALYWGCVRAYNEVGDFNETCSNGVFIQSATPRMRFEVKDFRANANSSVSIQGFWSTDANARCILKHTLCLGTFAFGCNIRQHHELAISHKSSNQSFVSKSIHNWQLDVHSAFEWQSEKVFVSSFLELQSNLRLSENLPLGPLDCSAPAIQALHAEAIRFEKGDADTDIPVLTFLISWQVSTSRSTSVEVGLSVVIQSNVTHEIRQNVANGSVEVHLHCNTKGEEFDSIQIHLRAESANSLSSTRQVQVHVPQPVGLQVCATHLTSCDNFIIKNSSYDYESSPEISPFMLEWWRNGTTAWSGMKEDYRYGVACVSNTSKVRMSLEKTHKMSVELKELDLAWLSDCNQFIAVVESCTFAGMCLKSFSNNIFILQNLPRIATVIALDRTFDRRTCFSEDADLKFDAWIYDCSHACQVECSIRGYRKGILVEPGIPSDIFPSPEEEHDPWATTYRARRYTCNPIWGFTKGHLRQGVTYIGTVRVQLGHAQEQSSSEGLTFHGSTPLIENVSFTSFSNLPARSYSFQWDSSMYVSGNFPINMTWSEHNSGECGVTYVSVFLCNKSVADNLPCLQLDSTVHESTAKQLVSVPIESHAMRHDNCYLLMLRFVNAAGSTTRMEADLCVDKTPPYLQHLSMWKFHPSHACHLPPFLAIDWQFEESTSYLVDLKVTVGTCRSCNDLLNVSGWTRMTSFQLQLEQQHSEMEIFATVEVRHLLLLLFCSCYHIILPLYVPVCV